MIAILPDGKEVTVFYRATSLVIPFRFPLGDWGSCWAYTRYELYPIKDSDKVRALPFCIEFSNSIQKLFLN